MAVNIFNGGFSQSALIRTVGADFPLDEYSACWRVYFNDVRTGQFITPHCVAPTTFSGGSDYAVCFRGSGGISTKWAIGSDGNDTYHASLEPVAGRWYRQVFRRRRRGINDYEQLFYFDVPTEDFVSRNDTDAATTGATTTLSWGAPQYTLEEGIDGRIADPWIFKGALPLGFLFRQTLSWQLVDARYRAAVWGNWRCLNEGDLMDRSGHGRHLSIVDSSGTGVDVTSIAHAPSFLSWRESVGRYDFDAGVITAAGNVAGPLVSGPVLKSLVYGGLVG